MKRIAIFLSGTGTNAERLIKHFAQSDTVEVATVISNTANAPAIERLKALGVEVEVWGRNTWKDQTELARYLTEKGIDVIVLAGFLAIIGEPLLKAFPGRIINIHPALLPKHGGKGMWGHHVHEAVLRDGDKESGITIHLVNEQVDGGAILEQHRCPVMPDDTPDTLAARVHQLEYQYFAPAVAHFLITL